MKSLHAVTSALVFAALAALAPAAQQPPVVSMRDGKLQYLADNDGNRVPDFSNAGYGGGGVSIPDIHARLLVTPVPGDNTARIQAALDEIAGRAADERGLRGAVVLSKGRFEIAGQLRLRGSGVVLRGQGNGPDGSVLVATGWDRRALIEVAGKADRSNTGAAVSVTDDHVPVGATRLNVETTQGLSIGMHVCIERPSQADWIAHVGMNDAPGRQPYQWKPGTINLRWDRVVVAIEGKTLVIDAPITTALEKRFGSATVTPFQQPGYLRDVGIENLRCESAYDHANPLDEQHAWNAIDFHAVRDGWVSDVTAAFFPGVVVQLGAKTARITVQDCSAIQPVSELGGYRRMPFHVRGQQALFLRCDSEFARHDFSTGYQASGPNVFLECSTRESHGFSGSLGSWASGLLFDNVKVDGGSIRFDNLETWNQGVGWAVANSMIWQSSAGVIVCRTPPGAANWADGVWGQFVGNGRWSQVNEFVSPDSLYRAQLAQRLGEGALKALEARKYPADTRAPAFAYEPAPQAAAATEKALRLRNGWLTASDSLLIGRQITTAWWLGRLEPARAAEFGPALTRFAPGRAGTGCTDEIPSVASSMVRGGQVAFRHHWGLWYDRRRIDHQMIRRPDSDVYPPFYEMPWARSGRGTAWDGLSRYDLTQYNPWYFGRLRQFAEEGRRQGVVLINAMYFQHNIIESGAHWVEFPWRPVNNLQQTSFVEPPPFNGDTINVAAAFYDIDDPQKRDLHRRFIRHSLDVLGAEPNVIHIIGDEYSGPRHFMEFWVDVVAEWQNETGRDVLVGLSGSKDVQDAILADARRAAVIDVIDFKYWFRTEDGREYAPAGGTDAAPRQHLRKWKGGRPTPASIAGMVAEYKKRFPEKAIIAEIAESDGWSFMAAGGSFAALPRSTDARLLEALVTMSPAQDLSKEALVLSDKSTQCFVYSMRGGAAQVDLTKFAGRFAVQRVDLRTGAVSPDRTIDGGAPVTLQVPGSARAGAWWLVRQP